MEIFLILLIVLAFYCIQGYLYKKNCFKNLFTDLRFTSIAIFEGEKTELIETLSNKKLLPLWWLNMEFIVSRHLLFGKDDCKVRSNDNYKKDSFSLLPYEKIEKRFTVTGLKRGYYKINQYTITTGDLFARFKFVENIFNTIELYVYPRLISSLELNIQFEKLIGEVITQRHIIEDPFELRGVREYYPFDSLKMVNWNATAKTGELKVNEYAYTASQEIMIFLNTERYNDWDPEDMVEECIRIAASLASEFLAKGISVGLISNGCDDETSQNIYIEPGADTNHNLLFYQNLARINISKTSSPLSSLISEEASNKNTQALWIVVSHYSGENLQEAVSTARSDGHNIKWILPKTQDSKLDVNDQNDLYIWEVTL